jgi:hypothetical protein
MSVPAIDYTSKDFAGFKASLLDYASREFPEWQSRSEGDFGVVLVELLSYMGDILSYYGDRLQAEAYLSTATQRLSILQIAELLGYVPSSAVPAVGTVTFKSANPGPASVVIPAGTAVVTGYIESLDDSIVYETDAVASITVAGGEVTVPVTQGQTRSMRLLGSSNGLASQQYRITERPVIENSVHLFVSTGYDSQGTETSEEWTQILYLVDGDSNDKVFATFNDEAGATWVSFGDNLNGQIPNNQLNVYATYRIGGGVVGNISANQVINIADPSVSGVSVSLDNAGQSMSSAMISGTDQESTDQIRSNAPRAFRTQNRAVTLQDFIDATISVPGVLRANAVAGSFTSVTVFVVGPNGAAPNALLISNVQRVLAGKALAGCSISVASPAFISVNVGGNSTSLGTVTVDITTGVLTVSAAHGLLVGDAVQLGTMTDGAPLVESTTYYVASVPTTTTLTLAATPGGVAIVTTSAGSSTFCSRFNPISVQVYGRYSQAVVLYNVQQAIRTMLGLTSVDFAMRLTVSDFYATIMSVEGVQYVTIPLVVRSDAVQSGTSDMVFRDWELPVLGNLVVTASGGVS